MTKIAKTKFGTVNDQPIDLYTINFPAQIEVKITNYGGIITSLCIPDRKGKMEDVVLGYDTIDGYLEESPYFGALIGRYGNRIAEGRFSIDNESYELAVNDGNNHLHGGIKGYDKVIWGVVNVIETEKSAGIVLQIVSPDGEEGYPGAVTATVTYTVTPNELTMEYKATTSKTTVINLTQHSYFNLSGNPSEDILDHELQINADSFLPVDNTMIPTGDIRSVGKSPFDFNTAKRIGEDIENNDQQINIGGGYDHCWVLGENTLQQVRKVATVSHQLSGRRMNVLTTEPGIQFYSGNFLTGDITGKNGCVYGHRSGLCLETQHFPNSPNQPEFPSTLLKPGETYNSKTVFQFALR